MLQRLGQVVGAPAQLIEQPRILDRDDCLFGEGLQQLDQFSRKLTRLLASDSDHADDVSAPQHWNRQRGAIARCLGCRSKLVVRVDFDIRDLDRPLRQHAPAIDRAQIGFARKG